MLTEVSAFPFIVHENVVVYSSIVVSARVTLTRNPFTTYLTKRTIAKEMYQKSSYWQLLTKNLEFIRKLKIYTTCFGGVQLDW